MFFVANDQLRVHVVHVLCNQAKLPHSLWINRRLVAERNGLQTIKDFAGVAHALNILLEVGRRSHYAKHALRVYVYRNPAGDIIIIDAGNNSVIRVLIPDPDDAVVPCNAWVPNTNVVTACRELTACIHSQRDVRIPRVVSGQRLVTDRRISVAGALRKRRRANPHVDLPCCAEISRANAAKEIHRSKPVEKAATTKIEDSRTWQIQ